MSRELRATAILDARDNMGGAFSAAAAKLKDLDGKFRTFERGAKALSQSQVGSFGKMYDASMKSIEGFRGQHEALKAARLKFRETEAEVQRLARAMKEASVPTEKMARDYERAQRAVKRASDAFQQQVVAVKAAKAEMAGYGVSLAGVRKVQPVSPVAIPGTRGGFGRKNPTAGAPHLPPDEKSGGLGFVPLTPGMIAPAAVGYGAARLHGAVVNAHHGYQEAYLYQQAVLGIDAQQQQPMLGQAVRIGQDTKFKNADIVRAQTDIGSKLPKNLQSPETIMAITEHTKNYALAMKVSMEEASVAMVGWMKSRGYDLSSPKAAEKSARRASNQMVEFAKTTGAKHHDLVGDTKFGAAPGRVGGFSEEFSNALSAQLIRIGYDGAMAGTFVRAAASKLSAPTQKGQSAIAAVGLNYADYMKPGADPSVGGLDKMLKVRFGRGLSKDQTSKLQEVFNDDDVRGDHAAFTEKVSGILNASFAKKGKDGKVNAQDAERIAKTVNEFASLSAQSVDIERLMTDVIKKGLTSALSKYLFGTEHGGRALSLDAKQLEEDKKVFQNVPENRAQTVAGKMQEGAQGEYTKMMGSVETFNVALGEATDGLRSFAYKGIGAFFDSLTALVQGKADFGRKIDAPKTLEAEIDSLTRRLSDPGLNGSQRRGLKEQLTRAQGRHMLSSDAVPAVSMPPLDVTGKVDAEIKGRADVSVTVKVVGEGKVTGTSASSDGHVNASVNGLNQGVSKAGNE